MRRNQIGNHINDPNRSFIKDFRLSIFYLLKSWALWNWQRGDRNRFNESRIVIDFSKPLLIKKAVFSLENIKFIAK